MVASIKGYAYLTEVSAITELGTITDVTCTANIFPDGVSTQGVLGSILIWNPINPDVPGNWVPVDVGPIDNWTPVAT